MYDNDKEVRWVEAFEHYSQSLPQRGFLVILLRRHGSSIRTERKFGEHEPRSEDTALGKRMRTGVNDVSSCSRPPKVVRGTERDNKTDDNDIRAPISIPSAPAAPVADPTTPAALAVPVAHAAPAAPSVATEAKYIVSRAENILSIHYLQQEVTTGLRSKPIRQAQSGSDLEEGEVAEWEDIDNVSQPDLAEHKTMEPQETEGTQRDKAGAQTQQQGEDKKGRRLRGA